MMRYGVPLSGLLLLASFAVVWFVGSEREVGLTTSSASQKGIVQIDDEDSLKINSERPPVVVALPRELPSNVVPFDDDQMYLEAQGQGNDRVSNGELPGVFARETAPRNPTVERIFDNCIISGCSSEICGDEEAMSTCEWEESYMCYRSAQCQRNVDGLCAWKETVELLQCLDDIIKTSLQ
jgi:hypothetical protein